MLSFGIECDRCQRDNLKHPLALETNLCHNSVAWLVVRQLILEYNFNIGFSFNRIEINTYELRTTIIPLNSLHSD